MNYDKILEMDYITLEDCINLYSNKNIYVVLNDGRITNLEKDENK